MANPKKKKPAVDRKKEQDARYDDRVKAIRERDEAEARRRAAEIYSPGSLGRLETPGAVAHINAPGEIGMISTEMGGGAQSISQAESAYTASQQRDQYVQDALTRMQAGLGGFSSPELQAQRAQAQRAIKGQTATALRNMRAFQGSSGVSGSGAARAQQRLLNEERNVLGNQETDLLVANAAEQRARLGDYGNFASTAYRDHETVKSDALQRLLGIRSEVANFKQKAEIQNQGAQGQNIANKTATDKINQDTDKYNLETVRDTALKNLEQGEKEKAGYIGVLFGDQQVTEAQREALKQEEERKRLEKIAARGA